MAKVTPISEHFQHFLAEMKETFWGDLMGRPSWRGSSSSSCNRSGSAIAFPALSATNGGVAGAASIVTATTSGIS